MFQNASLLKRFAACVYELMLLIAIWLVCTWLFLMLFGTLDSAIKRLCLQVFLWFVAGVYFVGCWATGGQTLAAQTWKIKLVNAQNNTLGLNKAIQRYVLASISILVFGLGFLWALVDKDQLFLYDRVLKTRLIKKP